MATAKCFVIGAFSSWASYITSLGCPFVSLVDGAVVIDNAIRVTSADSLSVFRGDTRIAQTSVNWRGAGSYSVRQYVVASDTFFYFNVRGYFENRTELVYEKIGNDSYYGVLSSQNNGTMPYKELSDFTLYKIGEETIKYFHGVTLNYAAQTGTCNYVQDSLFKITNTSRYIQDPNTIACSTVPAQALITIGNKKYFSLGTHHLIEMDN